MPNTSPFPDLSARPWPGQPRFPRQLSPYGIDRCAAPAPAAPQAGPPAHTYSSCPGAKASWPRAPTSRPPQIKAAARIRGKQLQSVPSQRPAVGALWRRVGGRNMCSWLAAPAQGSGELPVGAVWGQGAPGPSPMGRSLLGFGSSGAPTLSVHRRSAAFLPCVAIPRGREVCRDLVSIVWTTPGAGEGLVPTSPRGLAAGDVRGRRDTGPSSTCWRDVRGTRGSP